MGRAGRMARIAWSGVGAVAMSLLACGPAPYAEDAHDARDVEEGEAGAAPAAAQGAAPTTVVVVEAAAPPPGVVFVPAPSPLPPPMMAPPPPVPPVDPAVTVAFQRRMPELVKCYRKGLRRHPGLAGTVVVQLDLDEDGDVEEARDHGSTIPDRDVIGCVLDEVEDLDFKQFVGTRIVYPVVFHPGMSGP